jgi:hypothetical protein
VPDERTDRPADAEIVETTRRQAAALNIPLPETLTAASIVSLLRRIEDLLASSDDKSKRAELNLFKALFELWTELAPEKRRAQRKQLVLLVHGIRTHAEWQQEVAAVLTAADRLVKPLRYGFFDAVRFLCPFFTRKKPIERLKQELLDANFAYPDREIVVIAHSFGTFAVSEVLKDCPYLRPSALVLCGGIVSESFRWDCLPNRPPVVMNECGTRDVWPVLASASTWGYGATGRFGFGNLRVLDRFHDFGHGDFLNSAFARRYWLPFIETGTITPGLTHLKKTPYLIALLGIVPIRVIWLLPIVLVVALLFRK